MGTAPWGRHLDSEPPRISTPFAGLGVAGEGGSGQLTGSWGTGGKTLTMTGGHGLVPGMEARSFHAAVGDEGHAEVAGIGVECGGRHPPTHSARSQIGGDGGSELRASQSGACLGPAVLFPQAPTWGRCVQKVPFISSRALTSLAPAHPFLRHLSMGKICGSSIFQIWKPRSERGSDLPKVI